MAHLGRTGISRLHALSTAYNQHATVHILGTANVTVDFLFVLCTNTFLKEYFSRF